MFFFFSIATKRKKNAAPTTLWVALATSSTKLRKWSVTECQLRSALLATLGSPTLLLGEEPVVLNACLQLLDGRFAGDVGGSGRATLPRE